jgi:hypothetical protein
MCRAALPQVFEIDLKICNITVSFRFCRGDINIDKDLSQYRNTYIIHSILAAHNLTGFMDSIRPEDISIDMNNVKLDMSLSYKLASRVGCNIKELILGNDTEGIIESYYFPEYARPYIRQPSDEETEIESENLFKNIVTLKK